MPEPLILTYAAFFGLSLGSFLNVCIVRLPKNQSVFRPRSRCMACERQISWYENIPVLAYLVLRGRCRTCGVRISIRYPLVELAVGAIWVGSYLYYGLSWQSFSAAIFGTLLLGIAVTDASEYIIPDEFSLGGLVIGLALAFAPGLPSPLMSFVGAALSFALMYGVAVVGDSAPPQKSPVCHPGPSHDHDTIVPESIGRILPPKDLPLSWVLPLLLQGL